MNAAGLNEAITQGDKDFSADQQDEAGRTYAIYFGAYQTAAGLIVRQARDQELKAKFIGADALVTQEFGNVIGAAGEGRPKGLHAFYTLMRRFRPLPKRRIKPNRSKSTISQRR